MVSWSARVFWMIFWVVSLVVVTTYTGNLVAALATQHTKLPFTTLEELAEDKDYSITTYKSGAHHTLFEVCEISQ